MVFFKFLYIGYVKEMEGCRSRYIVNSGESRAESIELDSDCVCKHGLCNSVTINSVRNYALGEI